MGDGKLVRPILTKIVVPFSYYMPKTR